MHPRATDTGLLDHWQAHFLIIASLCRFFNMDRFLIHYSFGAGWIKDGTRYKMGIADR